MSEESNVNQEMPGQEGQQTTQEAQGTTRTNADSWQEVGQQFQALGASIAAAVRTAWEDEQTQKQVQEMRVGLESMVKDVSKAIDDSFKTPQGQQIRQDAERAFDAVQTAGKQTVQEVRPHLVSALQQLNQELQRLIERMEKKEPAKPETPEPPTE